MKKIVIMFNLIFLGLIGSVNAQLEKPVSWSYSVKKIDNINAIVFIKATIDEGWHIYAQNGKSGGPTLTKISFSPSANYALQGKTSEPKPIVKYEKAYGFNVNYYEKEVVFQQKIKLQSNKVQIKGKVGFMVCNDHQCLPPDEISFSVSVK